MEQPTISEDCTIGVSRRGFIRLVGVAGAGLVLGCYLPGKHSAASDARGEGAAEPFAPNAFLRIDEKGVVTIIISKPDMGQGPRTTLAMLAADELGVDWKDVRVEQAPADARLFGGQTVGGSSTVRSMYQPMRLAGATARTMLIAAAAKKWGVEADTLTLVDGAVRQGTNGKNLTIGELAPEAAKLPVPPREEVRLKSRDEFTIIGKKTVRVDAKNIATGKAVYGLDVKPAGVKVAVVARTPAFGAKVKSFDAAAAKKVPGVQHVFEVPTGVAVVADDTWAAMKGRDALVVEWDLGPNAELDSDTLYKSMRAALGEHLAMPAGAKVLDAEFQLPFLAHAPMEPMNCTVDASGGQCVMWVPTQNPGSCQDQAARVLGIEPSKVRVNVTLVGGGFGRRLNADYAAEAVRIAQQANCPVQVLWTRDDDMRHDYYRPASVHSCRAAVDADGRPLGWSHQYINAGGRGGRGGFGGAGIPYDIPNSGLAQGSVPSPIPTGAWRSVENTQTGFVNESLIDELAHLAGKDPLAFRLAYLRSDRLKKCLETAAQKAGWGTSLPKGRGRGIGCFEGYGSRIAQIVELSVEDGEVKLHKITAVVDCGLAVNPLGVIAQVQGGTTDALSCALRSEITIEEGGVAEGGWGPFGWMKMPDTPPVDVTILPSEDPNPGGMGEVAVPAITAAVANAIFAATGKRLRKLPIRRSDLA
ncbi:MAG TPA: molybdopterin-dependent oxidoreductase [Fimbriimonadaceae bacterium]|nr:molybdopterin-dependent oxidoreductase [Fimbriimonadaceae bacterium]HRJ97124.1 molybdopterin-dependent oxidoreductase [Fimbriimonadaceae bacterium]